jgi:DNA-directed RNA polymerase specialized sigma24 family protein
VPVTVGGPRFGPPGEIEKVRKGFQKAFETPAIPAGKFVRDMRAKVPFYNAEEDMIILPGNQHPHLEAFLNTVFDTAQVGGDVFAGLTTLTNAGLIGALIVAPTLGIPAAITKFGLAGLSASMIDSTSKELGHSYEIYRREIDAGRNPLASREFGQSLANATTTATFATLAGRGAFHPRAGELGIKAAWERYKVERPDVPRTKAQLEAELKAEQAGIPPPQVVPAPAIRAMEAASREGVKIPTPIDISQVSVPKAPPEEKPPAVDLTPPKIDLTPPSFPTTTPTIQKMQAELHRLKAAQKRLPTPGERKVIDRWISEVQEMMEQRRAGTLGLVSRRGTVAPDINAREVREARGAMPARLPTTGEVTQVSDIPSPNEFVPRKAAKVVPAKSKQAQAREAETRKLSEALAADFARWRNPAISEKVKNETIAGPLHKKFLSYAKAVIRKSYTKKVSDYLIDEGIAELAVSKAMLKAKTFKGKGKVTTWFWGFVRNEVANARRKAERQQKREVGIRGPEEEFTVGTVAEEKVAVRGRAEIQDEYLRVIKGMEDELAEVAGPEALEQVRGVAKQFDKAEDIGTRLGKHEQNLRNAILEAKRKKAVAPIEIPPEEAPVTDIKLPMPSRAELGTKRIDALVKKMERLGFGKAVKEIQAALPMDVSVEFWTDNFRAALARYVELKAQQDPRALEHAKFAAAKKPGQRRREGGFITLGEMLPQRIKEFINKRAAAVEEKKAKLKAFQDRVAELATKGPTFYSHLERVVEARMPNRAAPEQIGALVRKAGVTLAEAKWSGLDDLLALARKEKRPVTKQEVLDTLRKNQITIEEVELGQRKLEPRFSTVIREQTTYSDQTSTKYRAISNELIRAVREELRERGEPTDEAFEIVEEGLSYKAGTGPGDALIGLVGKKAQSFGHAALLAKKAAEAQLARTIESAKVGRDPEYSKYQLPGGENYKELLLKLPEREPQGAVAAEAARAAGRELTQFEHILREKYPEGRRIFQAQDLEILDNPTIKRLLSPEDLTTYGRLIERFETAEDLVDMGGDFRGGHFEGESNILAHIRFNERVDVQGKRVLFVEEMQSDWAQAERRPGIAVDAPPTPFLKDWHELSLKRMLRYAAEKGFDKLAWTTGKQQVARYDLAKVLSTIEYKENPLKPGQYKITPMDLKGNPIPNLDHTFAKEDLAPTFGKEIAEAITQKKGAPIRGLEAEGLPIASSGWRELDVKGIEVGGKSLRALYDNIIPNYLNKYGKKWGARVRTIRIPVPPEPNFPDTRPVHAIDITPEMKRSVLKGQRLMGGFGPTIRGKLNLGEKIKEAVSRLQNRQLPVVSKRYQEILQARKDAKGPTARFSERLAMLPRAFVRRFYDRFINIRIAERAIEKSIGRKLDPETEAAYLEARLVFGGEGGPMEAAAIRYGNAATVVNRLGLGDYFTQYLDLFAYRRGIANIVRKRTEALRLATEAKGNYDEVARQVTEGEITVKQGAAKLGRFRKEAARYRRQAKEFGTMLKKREVVPKKYDLMTISKELKDIEGNLSKQQFAEVKKAADAVWALNRKAWDLAHREGIISNEAHATGIALGKEYVPLWRIIEKAKEAGHFGDTNLQLRQQKILRAFKGSALENLDPLETSLLQHIETIREAGRNRAAKRLIQLRDIDPEGFGRDVRELKFREQPPPNMGQISYFENGRVRSFAVPKSLAQALNELNATDVGFIADTLLKIPKRWFQLGATQANLAFAIPNVARDVQRMAMISEARVRNPKDVALLAKDWSEAFFSVVIKNERYLEFLESRAAYSTLQRNITPKTFLFGGIEKVAPRDPFSRAIRAPFRPLSFTIDKIEKLNSAFEEATKMTTYRELRAKGVGVKEAAFETRRFGGSPDFASGGAYSRELNLLWMFFNANIQGTVGNISRLATNPKLLGTMMTTVTALALTLHKWNMQFLDDEGNPEIYRVSQTERDHNWVILRNSRKPTSAGATRNRYFKIPKPHVVRMLVNPIQEGLVQHSKGQMQKGKLALRAISDLIPGQFDLEKHGIGPGLGYGALSSLNPLPRTIIEVGGNISGFRGGAPIESRAMEGIEARERYTYTTSEFAKWLGNVTNKSPVKIQYTIESFLGGLGQMGLDVADLAMGRDFSPLPLEGDEAIARTPVVGRIAKRFVGSTMDEVVQDLERAFYEVSDKANEVKKTTDWKKKKYAETPEVAIDYAIKDPEKRLLYRMQPKLAEIRVELSEIRARRERVIMSKKLSIEHKRRLLSMLYKERVRTLTNAIRVLTLKLDGQGQ